jgi:uncharacterized protein YyaL (SSP411 family)
MNKLSQEISPYLLQHAENPVDWVPWSADAFAQAHAEQKPVFLSVGYSACHWCHVMAHESFENPQVAALLNKEFISIKVDREERPEIDQIYMEAVQAMTGHGGWPMSVFLTPDQKPFFGGTYWPLVGRGGMPGFGQVLSAVVEAWRDRRPDVLLQAEKATEQIRSMMRLGQPSSGDETLSASPLEAAEKALSDAFDPHYGGFGMAPKFPHATDLSLLLRRYQKSGRDDLKQMIVITLDRMAAGGIYDQLGGGFHRYSVDEHWLVPHFEKMLYDNAMLASAYLDAWKVTGHEDYARVVRETLDYVLRDLTDPQGGFYCAEDADSEGEEGKFYVWTPQEIIAALGAEAASRFCAVYDVTGRGNFEHHNILNLPQSPDVRAQQLGMTVTDLEAELSAGRQKLLTVRSVRVRPGLDDKVLVSWNGLAINAMARAGHALGDARYATAAAKAADFLLKELRDSQGNLLHCWRVGVARHKGLLDDHASVANALITLYETQPQDRWLDEAQRLVETILANFADAESGGFYYTPSDHEPLIARKKDLWDTPVPSSTGLAVTALIRLGRLKSNEIYLQVARRTLAAHSGIMERGALGAGQLLIALDMFLGE